MSSGDSVNSPPTIFFHQNEDGFFLKLLLYSSSILVHSHFSIRLNLPLNENEDFSTGKENIFWVSKYVDPDLFNHDHLSAWRQTIITDTAHEGTKGLPTRSEWIYNSYARLQLICDSLQVETFLGKCISSEISTGNDRKMS